MLAATMACLFLVLIHLSAGNLKFLHSIPRSRWLSVAGGISIAYVFVHLLPELSEAQAHFKNHNILDWLERHAYLIALIGLVTFYSLEVTVRHHRLKAGSAEEVPKGVFWLHIGSFSLYNALIGYILVEGNQPLFMYTVAMGFHFLVTDYSLGQFHSNVYRRKGRWVVSAAIVAGWLGGSLGGELPVVYRHVLVAFLAGGIILNVLKEELPLERESRLSGFFIGVFAYSIMLLWI